jgi:GDP-D-mannose dehydratase
MKTALITGIAGQDGADLSLGREMTDKDDETGAAR